MVTNNMCSCAKEIEKLTKELKVHCRKSIERDRAYFAAKRRDEENRMAWNKDVAMGKSSQGDNQ